MAPCDLLRIVGGCDIARVGGTKATDVDDHGLVCGAAASEHERGCLLLSANLQRDPKDVIVSNLRDNQARVEAIFDAALRRAQKEGELSAKEDAAALARFFVVTIQGMRAMARLQSDRKALEQVARVALGVFG